MCKSWWAALLNTFSFHTLIYDILKLTLSYPELMISHRGQRQLQYLAWRKFYTRPWETRDQPRDLPGSERPTSILSHSYTPVRLCLRQPVSTCWEFKDPQRAQTCITNAPPSKGWSFTFTSHALTHSHFCVSGVHSVHTFMCWWREKRPDWFLQPNPKRVQMDITKKKWGACNCLHSWINGLGKRTVEGLPYNICPVHKFKTELYCNSKYLVYK